MTSCDCWLQLCFFFCSFAQFFFILATCSSGKRDTDKSLPSKSSTTGVVLLPPRAKSLTPSLSPAKSPFARSPMPPNVPMAPPPSDSRDDTLKNVESLSFDDGNGHKHHMKGMKVRVKETVSPAK
ncbi:unnamed protein product [Caenorhabditis auriculariae]|uniref:Uncharacterized protein n=1 Tax=Caenorhabditis auriculariae TaxID=2777116 RepID=A0A8S1HLJ8_9PELO|nr:unnamed protein product [Caenorhabditis auriculariae]